MIQEMGGSLGEDFYPVGIFGIKENESIGVITAHDDKNVIFVLVGGSRGKNLRGIPSYSNENLRSCLRQILRTLDFLIPENCNGLHFENEDYSYAIDYAIGGLRDLDKDGFTHLYPVRTVAFDLENGMPVSIKERHDMNTIDIEKLDPATKVAIQTNLGFMVARVGDMFPFFKGISDQLREYLGASPDALVVTFGLSNIEKECTQQEKETFDKYTRFAIFASLIEEDVNVSFLVPVSKKTKGATSVSKLLRPILEQKK